jgi:hypothetical protein
MGVWAWIQPVDRVWKVVSDTEKGKISVYNEKNNLIFEQKGLSKEAVSLIEKEFLGLISTNLSDPKANAVNNRDNKKPVREYNSMYA